MRSRLLIIGVMTFVVQACAREPEPPTVLIEASQLKPLLYWSGDLDGKRVAIDGYVNLDNGPNGDAIAMGPQLTSRPLGRGDELIAFEVEQGEGPNQLNLPVLKTTPTLPGVPAAGETMIVDMSAATFQDSTGEAHKLREKARVTGRVGYSHVRGYVVSEQDTRSPTGRRFRPHLIDAIIDVAPAS